MNLATEMAVGPDWLPWLAELALKASVVLLLTAAAAAMLWRASAATRHLVWCVGVMGVLALPLFSALLPAWQLPVLPVSAVATDAALPAGASAVDRVGDAAPAPRSTESAQPGPATAREWLPGAAVAVVGFGIVAGLLWLTAGFWGVSRIGRRAEVVRDPEWLRSAHDAAEWLGLRRPVLLLRSRAPVMPATWGLLWPSVVLPQAAEQWSDDRRRAVLAHELAHVKRFDCLTQALAQVACALFWWHPGVWYAARRLRVERERACDDLVLGAGARPSEYAGHLLEIARMHKNLRLAAPAMVSMARPSHLESRLLWVLDAARVRTPPSVRATVMTLLLAVLVVAPLAAMRPVAGDPAAFADADDHAVSSAVKQALQEESDPDSDINPDLDIDPDPDPMVDVGLDLDPDVQADSIPLSDLLALRRVGVDAAYIAEMRAAGYTDLSVRQLVTIKSVGVTGRFAREMNAAGYGRLSPDQLAEASSVGMTPAYLDDIRAHGFPQVPLRRAIRMKSVGVTGQYIARMRDVITGPLNEEAIVSLQSVGITPEFVREMAASGFGPITAERLLDQHDDEGVVETEDEEEPHANTTATATARATADAKVQVRAKGAGAGVGQGVGTGAGRGQGSGTKK